jgi:N-carbamoyl-L-amino-acid hydrolase
MVVAGKSSLDRAWNAADLKNSSLLLKEELERIGYMGSSDPTAFRPAAFVELHIEQGPVLEKKQVTIGVVESVQGIYWTRFDISGEANHAGTTPMTLRRDAGYVAAQIATRCRRLTGEYTGLRATAGMIDHEPNLINVIAGKAYISTDLRCPNKKNLESAEITLQNFANECSYGEGCDLDIRSLTRVDPVDFDKKVIATVADSTRRLGYTATTMVSGAGHDAQLMAGVCPSAMIFIPSKHGISHSVKEYSSPDDCVSGTNVLLHTVISLAGR